MSELEKLKEHEELFLINDDLWWSKGDIPAYKYFETSHSNEMENIIPHLKDNKVAIQAGAHCGFVITELKPHFETIYTFEPDHSMFLAMCMNIPDRNVFKFQACLGNEHKLVNMVQNEICPLSGANFVKGEGNIPMIMIDDLNLNNCDLIMLDTEGYEYNALIGATKTIEKYKPLICIERYWGPTNSGISEATMDKLLNGWGYKAVARAGESDHIYKCE